MKLQGTATKISDALLQFIYSLYIIYKIKHERFWHYIGPRQVYLRLSMLTLST